MEIKQNWSVELLLAFCICISFNFWCCRASNDQQSSTSSGENEYSQPADTIRRNEVKKVIDEINSQLGTENYFKIPFPIKNAKDTLEYWIVNNEPARISLKLYPSPEVEEWPTFFVKDGELILVRLRTWSKSPPTSWARESMVFLDKEIIFYCDERRMDLPEGVVPAYLREIPMTMSTRPFSEIENEYSAYWAKVKEFLMEHKKTLNKSN